MQHRARHRPKFWNPFAGTSKITQFNTAPLTSKDISPGTRFQPFRGYLRSVPFYGNFSPVLNFVARRPYWFGVVVEPVCVLDPRDMTLYHGTSRGCKSIILPECDAARANIQINVLVKILQFNPSIDTLVIGKQMEAHYKDLARAIENPANRLAVTLARLCLPQWNDAKAIAAVAMAFKKMEILDLYGPSVQEVPSWETDASAIQAIVTMIELHPKLRAIEGAEQVLITLFQCTQHSRCKHNIALVPVGCAWANIFNLLWHFSVFALVMAAYYFVYPMWHSAFPDVKTDVPALCLMLYFVLYMAYEHTERKFHRGPSWAFWMSKFLRVGARIL
eukprot:PhM_4_TR1297/c0_g3_i2/m.58210